MTCVNCFSRLRHIKLRKQKQTTGVVTNTEEKFIAQSVAREDAGLKTAQIGKVKVIPGPIPAQPPVSPPAPANSHAAFIPKIAVRKATADRHLSNEETESQSKLATHQSPSAGDVIPETTLTKSLNTPRHPRRNSGESTASRSTRSDSGSSKTAHCLKEQLYNARSECPLRPHTFLVPRDVQQDIITKAAIVDDIQAHNTDITHKDAEEYAEKACQDARCLYATLAYIKHGADICALLNEGINDQRLPLLRKANDRNASLYLGSGELVRAMTTWKPKHRENFDRVQWWMTSPIFECGEHYSLDEKTVLPFIPLDPKDASLVKKQGGYSEVYPVRIHPAHHKFWKGSEPENEALVAVKQLFSSDETEFLKESTILKTLGPKNHANLIKLLATYEMGKRYHLMFPYANANLRKYWEDHPSPVFNKDTLLWSLKQICGIASGLQLIHSCQVTVPLSVPGAGGAGSLDVRLGKGKDLVQLTVKMGEQWFGRHGDIKPENVLWFAKDQDSAHPHSMGVLKIADFGLGRFHGRDSRSEINPESVVSSPTYEPPECKLRRPVSRAYDIWSLGCIYLEFITWILRGSPAIDDFADFRGREATNTGINEDNFFTIVHEDGVLKANLREGVLAWSEQLHANKNCSELLHDLLDLIMSELLVIESENRIKASWLHFQLNKLLEKAESDADYLLKPVPRKLVSGRSNSAPLLETPKMNVKRNSVTFLDQEKPAATKTPLNKPPRDLVLRNLGTPSFDPNNVGKTKTWPVSQRL